MKLKPRALCFLPCSQAISSLSYTIQTHPPRDDAAHGGRDPPSSISSQENVPQTGPQANLMEAVPRLRSPLPRCVKLMKQRLANRVSDPVSAMEAVSSLAFGFLGARGGIVWSLLSFALTACRAYRRQQRVLAHSSPVQTLAQCEMWFLFTPWQ